MIDRQNLDNLIKAICNQDPMYANGIGLSLTANELEYIYGCVGDHFVKERMIESKRPDVVLNLVDFTGVFGGNK